jgi:PII-like signaling protein
MLEVGPAVKITIHINEDTSSHRDFLHNEILAFLYEHGVSGATILKPFAGFGSHHHLHTSGAGSAEGEHLPVRIEFIEKQAKIDALLPELFELVTDGLIEAKQTTILKVARPQNTKPSRH